MNTKVALVTGAGSGIGEAVALAYAANGWKVVVCDLNEEGGKKTVDQLLAKGADAVFFKADVSVADQCADLVQFAITTYGRLDIACNNAGIGGEQKDEVAMSLENWHHVIGVNLSSVFYCMKYEIAQMLKQGSGSIVNMGSILSQVGFNNAAAYVAAKHGVVGLTQNAALEFSGQGIRINTVGPGFINTPLLSGLSDELKKGLVSLHPIGRLGEAAEVAELVSWLSSDKASFVTGAYYPIDGGYLAR